jgi:hypothetical protein
VNSLNAEQMGATQITVGISAITQFIPSRWINGVQLRKISGGTLSIIQGPTYTAGYVVGDTEALSIQGPAVFFMAAAGSPVVVGALLNYSKVFGSTTIP